MTDVVLAERVVEVLFNAGTESDPQWRAGSGFVVSGPYVLTSAHVVGLGDGELIVRFGGTDERVARVAELPGGGPAFDEHTDLAVVEIRDRPPAAPPVPVGRLRDNPTLAMGNLDECVAFGFPAFQARSRSGRDRPIREVARVDGYVPTGQGAVEGLATLRIRDAPQHPAVPAGALSESPWRGFSGSVVFAGGVGIGVVSEHHPPAGVNGLTVVPLTWIDRLDRAVHWWAMLGVTDPAALPVLPPADPEREADAILERRYLELLLRAPDFDRLPTPFESLPAGFYQPRLLRPVVAPGAPGASADEPARSVDEIVMSVPRLVVTAGAGMGKSELLRDLARRMASGELPGIPLFVRLHDLNRRGGGRDLIGFAVAELLTDVAGEDGVAQMVAALRRTREDDPDAVVYLFDGMDEVPVAHRDETLSRVRRAGRFVLTSRPGGRIDALQDGTYGIVGLDDTTVRGFVARWEEHGGRTPGLLDELARDVRLAELARLPQMLMLLCHLWRPVSAGDRSRVAIIGAAIDESLDRAVRLADLPDGDEEVVPGQVRRALQITALRSLEEPDEVRLTFPSEQVLTVMSEVGGVSAGGRLLRFARRTGLLVAAATGSDLQYPHDVFRVHLAAEGLLRAEALESLIDSLVRRSGGEDALIVAAALEPGRMPGVILDRIEAVGADLFRMNWRLAALCMSSVGDLRPYESRLRRVADEVLAGAAAWWSLERFVPAIGGLRTDYMRERLASAAYDEDPFIRLAAIEGIRQMIGPEWLPLLADRLAVEMLVPGRTALIRALGSLRDPAAIPPLWSHYEAGIRAPDTYYDFYAIGESLGRLAAEPELRTLIDRVVDRVDGEDAAIQVLIGARPFAPEALADDIAAALSRRVVLTEPADVARYLMVSRDPEAAVEQQLAAIGGLGAAATGETAGALIDVLVNAGSPEVADAAGRALRDLDGETSFVDVAEHLYHLFRSEEDRAYAARAFLRLWTSPAQNKLADVGFPPPDELGERLIRDDDEEIRATAAIMSALSGAVPESVFLDLADGGELVRETAAMAIGGGQLTGAGPLLARLARDPAVRVRIAALRGLTYLPSPEGTAVLAEALDADDPAERTEAAEALVHAEADAAVPRLVERLRIEEDRAVRMALVRAAIDLSPEGRAPVEVAAVVRTGLDGADDLDSWIALAGQMRLSDAAPRLREWFDDARYPSAERAYGQVAPFSELAGLAADLSPGACKALATAIQDRPDVVDRLVALIRDAGGEVLIAEGAVVIGRPGYTYTSIRRRSPREPAELVEDVFAADPAVRWNAVNELTDRWSEADGLLGCLGVAMLDENRLVAADAQSALEEVAESHTPDALDALSLARISDPAVRSRLIDLLDGDPDEGLGAAWLLTRPVFLPALLAALSAGHLGTRQVLWALADRYGLRLFADGRARLATGREVTWDELPAALA